MNSLFGSRLHGAVCKGGSPGRRRGDRSRRDNPVFSESWVPALVIFSPIRGSRLDRQADPRPSHLAGEGALSFNGTFPGTVPGTRRQRRALDLPKASRADTPAMEWAARGLQIR